MVDWEKSNNCPYLRYLPNDFENSKCTSYKILGYNKIVGDAISKRPTARTRHVARVEETFSANVMKRRSQWEMRNAIDLVQKLGVGLHWHQLAHHTEKLEDIREYYIRKRKSKRRRIGIRARRLLCEMKNI